MWPCHQQERVLGTLQFLFSGWLIESRSHGEPQSTGGSTRWRPDSTAACEVVTRRLFGPHQVMNRARA